MFLKVKDYFINEKEFIIYYLQQKLIADDLVPNEGSLDELALSHLFFEAQDNEDGKQKYIINDENYLLDIRA
jgi:hypothetical protein